MIRSGGRKIRPYAPVARGCILPLLLSLGVLAGAVRLPAQVMDAYTPQDGVWVGVGPDSADFAAQSFRADLTRVRKMGVWLRKNAGTGEVRIALMKDSGFDRPDFGYVLRESRLMAGDPAGGWAWDSTFSAVLIPGQKYWVVIDGYMNLQGTGYATVGTSRAFTDTGDAFRYSNDGGANWVVHPGRALAIAVEGDNCAFHLSVTPQLPLLCAGSQVQFGVPPGYVSYAWSDGQTASTIWAGATGIYSVTVVDEHDCRATASVLVGTGIVPVSTLEDRYESCPNDGLELSVSPSYHQYLWSSGNTTHQDTVTAPGRYWLRMVSVSGCVTLDTFDVAFYDLPRIRLGRDSTLCTGDSVLLDAGPGFEAYAWSTAEYTPGIVLGSTAAAWVEVTDTNGCTSRSDTAAFTFLPSPSPPVVQLLDDGLQSTFSNAYAWYRDGVLLEGQTGRELPSPAPGLYAVVVTNAYGCSARSDAVEVGPPAVGDFVSEAISPNGDGINEFFLVEGAGRYPDLSLVVLDRYGNEVFRRKPYRNDWNGTGKAGNPLPAGDYFFLLDFGAARPAVQGNLLIGR